MCTIVCWVDIQVGEVRVGVERRVWNRFLPMTGSPGSSCAYCWPLPKAGARLLSYTADPLSLFPGEAHRGVTDCLDTLAVVLE